jgi:hypothetical protein
MHFALTGLTLALFLVCAACTAPGTPIQAGAPRVWVESGFGVDCDAFGRCWDEGPANLGPGFRYLYGGRWAGRSPFWYEPDRKPDRFVKTGSGVRCDRATRICYKRGRVDKSETQNAFGERAGDRADGWRDSVGTAHMFVTRGGAACDRERRVCFNDGEPDRRLTERFFGRRGKKDRD